MVKGFPQIKLPSQVCNKCCTEKQAISSNKTEALVKTIRKLEAIHSDVCGPFEYKCRWGNNYFVLFIGEFTKKLMIYLIAKKNDVFEVFKKFKLLVQNESGKSFCYK